MHATTSSMASVFVKDDAASSLVFGVIPRATFATFLRYGMVSTVTLVGLWASGVSVGELLEGPRRVGGRLFDWVKQ